MGRVNGRSNIKVLWVILYKLMNSHFWSLMCGLGDFLHQVVLGLRLESWNLFTPFSE